jgi:leader peptidase (prepilin peptidase)/N-methyltransferase
MPAATALLDCVGVGLGAGVAAVLLLAPGFGAPLLLPGTIALLIGWIVWRDGASYLIPDGAVAALALLGAASRVAAEGVTSAVAFDLLADVALTGGVLWLLREGFYRLRGHDGLGFGDVKLAGAAGCLVGAEGFAVALLAASLAGLAAAALRGAGRTDRIAFGVLLAPAIGLVWAALALAPVALESLVPAGSAFAG